MSLYVVIGRNVKEGMQKVQHKPLLNCYSIFISVCLGQECVLGWVGMVGCMVPC